PLPDLRMPSPERSGFDTPAIITRLTGRSREKPRPPGFLGISRARRTSRAPTGTGPPHTPPQTLSSLLIIPCQSITYRVYLGGIEDFQEKSRRFLKGRATVRERTCSFCKKTTFEVVLPSLLRRISRPWNQQKKTRFPRRTLAWRLHLGSSDHLLP